MSANFTPNKEDIKILPPFKMQVLTNFPYIEADFDALTNYQLLCKIVEYLNAVIHNENEVTEEVTGLYNAYVSLQDYVNNYFDNLDVQEEINNKLDEMAESGELTDIIAQYLGLAGMITYNTVAELKAAENIVNGSKCETLGYHEVNDGGGAIYKIRNITNEDVVDEGSIIALHNELLVAELIVTTEVNIKQFGAYGDSTHDDTTAIQNAVDFAFPKGYDVKILPTSTYYKVTSPIILTATPDGIGDKYWAGNGTRFYGDYKAKCKIVKIGTSTSGIENYDYNATLICKSELGTGVFIDNLTIGNFEDAELTTKNSTAYSIFTRCPRSTYSNLNIDSYNGIGCGDVFSCLFENIVYNCVTHCLTSTDGTSNTYRFMFAHDCVNPYDIVTNYSTFLNCASDNCTGSIYKLSGMGITLLNCGCESKKAQYIIEQRNNTWFNVTIQGMNIDRQVGDATHDLAIGDCAVVYGTNTGIVTLRDVNIIEREAIASGNSSIFRLGTNNLKFTTTVENLSYYKNFTGTSNPRMKIWGGSNITASYTYHKFNSGSKNFTYNMSPSGQLIPFVGTLYGASNWGELNNESLLDNTFVGKSIYLNATGRYTIDGTAGSENIQYKFLPSKGDIHLYNDPENSHALGMCITKVTNEALFDITRIPLIQIYTTENRPTEGLFEGLCIYDSTLKKPIWYNGSAWKDAAGNSV